jgi:hypothetical protein
MTTFALFAALSIAAGPKASPDELYQVRGALSGIHQGPDYESIRTVPHAREAMIAIAGDGKEYRPFRGRALWGIASYQDEAAFEVVRAYAEDARHADLKRDALRALAKHYGNRALPLVEKALADADPEVRKAGANAASLAHTPEAADAVKAALAGENVDHVKTVFQAALREIAAPLAGPSVRQLVK